MLEMESYTQSYGKSAWKKSSPCCGSIMEPSNKHSWLQIFFNGLRCVYTDSGMLWHCAVMSCGKIWIKRIKYAIWIHSVLSSPDQKHWVPEPIWILQNQKQPAQIDTEFTVLWPRSNGDEKHFIWFYSTVRTGKMLWRAAASVNPIQVPCSSISLTICPSRLFIFNGKFNLL